MTLDTKKVHLWYEVVVHPDMPHYVKLTIQSPDRQQTFLDLWFSEPTWDKVSLMMKMGFEKLDNMEFGTLELEQDDDE